jgi:hypothetical protein
MAQLRAENEALRNQIVHLQVQWDILKTTLGVLSPPFPPAKPRKRIAAFRCGP